MLLCLHIHGDIIIKQKFLGVVGSKKKKKKEDEEEEAV